MINELTLDIAPVLLGSGERIFDGVEFFGFEPAEVLDSPLTTTSDIDASADFIARRPPLRGSADAATRQRARTRASGTSG